MRQVVEKIRQLAIGMSSRDRPILLHDNAKPHTASQTKSTLEALGFDVLSHSAYSPDLMGSVLINDDCILSTKIVFYTCLVFFPIDL